MSEEAKCELCGEPMPLGEEMFRYHGHSGPCPKPITLKDHQLRVVEEVRELNGKLGKLREFLAGDKFPTLSFSEQQLLTKQEWCMREYAAVLEQRVAGFKN